MIVQPSRASLRSAYNDRRMPEPVDHPGNDPTFASAFRNLTAAARCGRMLAERDAPVGALLDEYLALRARFENSPEELAQLDLACITALEAFVESRAQQAGRDPVTGLPGRAAFEKALAEEEARVRRYDRFFSLALIDLDDFKTVNDRFGHQAGDRVLGETARELRAGLRESDRVFRYGGDEFAVLSPETRAEDLAFALARVAGRGGGAAGFSCGIAGFPDEADTAGELVKLVDERLYANKRKRNETE
ncbi:MAG: GGDEF domain-containing protein [Blastocatellales bacterium]|nr:GGDEF domain-containing protein [Blastocatellales bacterium]